MAIEAPDGTPKLAINTGTEDSASASFNGDGTVDTSRSKESVGVAFNPDGSTYRTDLPDEADVDAEVEAGLADEEDPAGPDAEPTPEEGGKEAPTEDLPDFDPESEEVMAAYKERYIKEDGSVNFEAFNDTFHSTGNISDNQRAFAKKHLGVSDQAIDTYLNGVREQTKQADEAIYSGFGGKESFDTALAWASAEGGYTAAQKEAFNAALKKGGEDLSVQLELLKARHDKVAAKAAPAPAVKQERRKSSPEASATSAAPNGAPKAEPYASLAEYQKDMAAANAAQDVAGMRAAEARLKASPKLYRPGR